MSAAENINGRYENDPTEAEIVRLRAAADASASLVISQLGCLTEADKLQVLA